MASLRKPTVNSMSGDLRCATLDSLGVLRARGTDVRSFLQGQLSNDLTRLEPGRALLAGLHNPQGRVIALLRVLQLSDHDLLAVLPRELVSVVMQRLGKFILRAKVALSDESSAWTIDGVLADAEPPAGTLPAHIDGVARLGEAIVVRLAAQPPRWLLVRPAHAAAPASFGHCRAAAPLEWRRLAIAAAEAQVYGPTSEEFVAQMLNLDVLGAIAFDKGCYTGQEVIARAHYRGRVKRRLQRFVTRLPVQLEPAAAGRLGDGRPFKVVEAVALPDGRCEFLAVAPLVAGAPAEAEPTAAAAAHPLEAEQLPLPYRLPD
jgi:tRNA-modifying protein YgfZ